MCPAAVSSKQERRTWLVSAFLLVGLIVGAYIPAMNGGFVWDDDDYVQDNLTLRSLAGLGQIWFQPGATRQYYPLVHTTYWLEYRLWGLDPTGYHVVNVILHALSAVLIWQLLMRLKVPGAWAAAALFALHPVHVESVAWIAVLGQGRLIHLRFAAIFRNGTIFKPFVRRVAAGTSENLWQQVGSKRRNFANEQPPTDAEHLRGGQILGGLSLAPNPFTPNGDGVNDELTVAFSIFQVPQARQVRLRLYSLDGRLIWENSTQVAGGPQQIRRNGRDAAGQTVPPGFYICRIDFGADSDHAIGVSKQIGAISKASRPLV